MNKFAKVLSIVLSATIALSIAAVMFVSSLAASSATFTLAVKEETDTSVTLVVKLTDGSFCNVDLEVDGNTSKIGKCTAAYDADGYADYQKAIKKSGAQCGSAAGAGTKADNIATFSAAATTALSEKNTEILECVFQKKTAEKVTADDFTLVVSVCGGADKESITAKVVNSLPSGGSVITTKATTTKATTTTTKATTTKATTTTTKATTTTTKATTTTTKAAATTTTTKAADTTTTTAATTTTTVAEETSTEVSTEAASTEIADVDIEDETSTEAVTIADDEDADVAGVTEDVTVVAGDVVNPDTGDSATASVAVLALLSVSAAAVVALRKKED